MKKFSALGMVAIGMAVVLVEGFHETISAGDAVSGLNGKVSGLYGDVDGDDAAVIEASISMPLGKQFGFQADGLLGEIDPENIYGIGGHLFWRDSQFALLGITGTWAEYNDIEVNSVGLESEYYVNRFTFAATLGYQAGDLDDAVYGGVEGRFYPVGDLLLSAAWRRADNQDLYGVGAEWQTPISILSLFAQLATGDDDYEHAFGGVRFYLGELKTLARRHREDDPPSMLLQSLTANLRAAQAAVRARETLGRDEGIGRETAIPGEGAENVDPGGDSPGGDSPGGDSPGGDSPEGGSPGGDSPEGDSPEGDSPEGDSPGGDSSGGDSPEGDSPEDDSPGGDSPEDDGPEGNDPEDDGPEDDEGERDKKKDSKR